MSTRQSPGGGSRPGQLLGRRLAVPTGGRAPLLAWRAAQILIVAAAGYAVWRILGHLPYRIDVDVYRMGGRAWLDGRPLYADGTTFATRGGIDLPFTYPPLAAIMFSPLAVVPLQAAEVVITVITFLLLGLSTWIVLTGLRVWPHGPGGEPASVRRAWLAAGLVAAATIWLEPIQANFSFGQVNAVLMTLVIADCVPRRTPWPRGVLLGIAIALKLTPAVFLLYFLLRRDARAALTALASFVVASLLGCALAWRDSVEYWTTTVRHTDRIGTATLNTNQNAAGALARLGLGESAHFLVWTGVCLLVLALTVWSARRVSRADEPELVLICVALFGLVVSPVSWSHHWVWALPTVLVLGVLAYRRRNPALAAVCVAGVALMVWPPLYLLPEHHEASAAWWRQLFGMSYVWWALTVIAVSGATVTANRPRSPESAPAADLVRPGQ